MAEEATIQDEDYQKLLKNVVIGSLKKGLLCKGLHEVCKAIEAKQARFAILANNCDEQHYKMLIQALCKENNIKLLTVQDQGVLAEWIGICKLDATQQVRKRKKCSSLVVKEFPPEILEEERKIIEAKLV